MQFTPQIQSNQQINNRLDIQHSPISIKVLSGAQISSYAKEMGELLLDVYKEWPYLYAGTPEEIKEYIQKRYIEVDAGVVCVAFDGNQLIGLSMGVPLSQAPSHCLAPFTSSSCIGYPLEDVFYWGEIIVKPKFRQKKIASSLCEQMIKQAMQARKYKAIALCAVKRLPDFHLNHLKPSDYFSTDSWWKKLGFTKYENLIVDGIWHLVGEQIETKNQMTYWIKNDRIFSC